MQVKYSPTRHGLASVPYKDTMGVMFLSNSINFSTSEGSDLFISMYSHGFYEVNGNVFFHNGTKDGFDVLKNKLQNLIAIELL